MTVCDSFLCKYNVDDLCNDNVQCGDCLYFQCEYCVYYNRVSEFSEECILCDGCGCGQAFNPD